jgi:hypothetical protein
MSLARGGWLSGAADASERRPYQCAGSSVWALAIRDSEVCLPVLSRLAAALGLHPTHEAALMRSGCGNNGRDASPRRPRSNRLKEPLPADSPKRPNAMGTFYTGQQRPARSSCQRNEERCRAPQFAPFRVSPQTSALDIRCSTFGVCCLVSCKGYCPCQSTGRQRPVFSWRPRPGPRTTARSETAARGWPPRTRQ